MLFVKQILIQGLIPPYATSAASKRPQGISTCLLLALLRFHSPLFLGAFYLWMVEKSAASFPPKIIGKKPNDRLLTF